MTGGVTTESGTAKFIYATSQNTTTFGDVGTALKARWRTTVADEIPTNTPRWRQSLAKVTWVLHGFPLVNVNVKVKVHQT